MKINYNNGPYSFWYGGVYYQNVMWMPVPPIYAYGGNQRKYTLEDLGFKYDEINSFETAPHYVRGTQELTIDLDKMKILVFEDDEDAYNELSYDCLQAIMDVFEEGGGVRHV